VHRPSAFDSPLDYAALGRLDPALHRVTQALPLVARRRCPEGFAGMVWLIVGQQVSTASARAVWARLAAATGGVDAATLTTLSDEALRACGFSRPKIAYVRALAEARFDFAALAMLCDEAAVAALMRLKGVGRWTAETYLMMGEGRADFFPAADIALQEAVRRLDGLEARPDAVATAVRAESWAPHRSAAAHLLWAWYGALKAGSAVRATLT
jgi:DNA-3-methyladenine glycosylase II